MYLAQASGNLISSQLLKRQSWIGHKYEMRNYSATFIIGIVCSVLCITWTILRVEFKNSVPDQHTDNNPDLEVIINNNNEGEEKVDEVKQAKAKRFSEKWRIAKEVLHPKHVLLSFQTVISKRDRPGVRLQIILLMICHIMINLEKLGVSKILFTFTQRMFFWDVEMFSFINVLGLIGRPITTLILVPVLAKVFKFIDIEIAIFGVVSMILQSICIGSILSPTGFYISIGVGLVSDAANISVRSKMSRIIDHHEVAQIFGALTTIEVLCPFIAVAIYTNIFNYTMAVYPTLIMQISTAILIIPLVIYMFIDLKFERRKL